VAKLAEDKKGEDTEILDITKVADIADYVLITSAQTAPQLKAIASHIEDSLTKMGMEPAHKEGKYGDKWFLLDYIDFVVHVIQSDAREFYNLEELWSKASFVSPLEWANISAG
jgi:ribosome-associated protein